MISEDLGFVQLGEEAALVVIYLWSSSA